MVAPEQLDELRAVIGDVTEKAKGGVDFVVLPRLVLPEGCTPREMRALLCLGQHGGYTTRLFLQLAVAGRGRTGARVVLGSPWGRGHGTRCRPTCARRKSLLSISGGLR
jgi:hypothetical protein